MRFKAIKSLNKLYLSGTSLSSNFAKSTELLPFYSKEMSASSRSALYKPFMIMSQQTTNENVPKCGTNLLREEADIIRNIVSRGTVHPVIQLVPPHIGTWLYR